MVAIVMRMRRYKSITIILLVLLGGIAVYHWTRNVPTLRAALKIDYADRKAVPVLVWAGPDRRIYTLTPTGRAYPIKAYAGGGKVVWQKSVRANPFDSGILVSAPGLGPTYAYLHQCIQQPSIVWLLLKGRQIVSRRLSIHSAYPVSLVSALDRDGDVYVAGVADVPDNAGYPMLIKIDKRGRPLWARTDPVNGGRYDYVAMDKQGDLFVAGTVVSAEGTCTARYSASGRRIWLKRSIAPDSEYTMWAGVRRDGNIAAIVRLHSKYHVLVTYDRRGRLVSTELLSRGGLMVADAVLDNRDDLFVLGNTYHDEFFLLGDRRFYGDALLTKYDALGHMVWSGSIALPAKCEASYVVVDKRGGVYVVGYWPPYPSTVPDGPPVKAFIYKFLDRK